MERADFSYLLQVATPRRTFIASAPFVAAAFLEACSVNTDQEVLLTTSQQELLLSTYTNDLRVKHGLPPFGHQLILDEVARERSLDMVRRGYFGHTTPDETQVFDELVDLHYSYKVAGENIARNNYPSVDCAQIAFEGFYNSPGHRANMLDFGFTFFGIGYAYDYKNKFHYFTQIFTSQ